MDKKLLEQMYLKKKMSVREIAHIAKRSESGVNYWLAKHSVKKRSISDAIYTKHNPNGDPFIFQRPRNIGETFLFGLGVGLYWGEGTKKSPNQVRLGNTDPYLVRSFIAFLYKLYGVDKDRLRFGLQIFTDMNQRREERFWQDFLGVPSSAFYKTINTRSGSIGTYRAKSEHGVITVYFNNKKLRDVLIGEIDKIRNSDTMGK
jgi:hypothetical protein